jgi:hypothetical protein
VLHEAMLWTMSTRPRAEAEGEGCSSPHLATPLFDPAHIYSLRALPCCCYGNISSHGQNIAGEAQLRPLDVMIELNWRII